MLSSSFQDDVVPWLKLAEDLQSLNLESELNVPQICVMGDQSSGKSSVLEALSGIPFPRGTGLVTRCPIRLVMRKARGQEIWGATVATSLNPKAIITVTNPADLSKAIDTQTENLCKSGNTFSTDSIVVNLISPDASDLTVVDLPGIIRTVTSGQKATVIDQVNGLIRSFLVDKRTIILAVIPGNQDIATVDILERAQAVDRSGERTLGVITKTDLIGAGGEEEVLSVVNNVRKPLALGYIMLKNRSQKDLVDNISAAQAREKEDMFFKNHPVFRYCDPKLYGIENLSKKLTSLLVTRIKREMIPMKMNVERELEIARKNLRALTHFAPGRTSSDRQKLLVVTMQDFLRHLTNAVRGEYKDRLMVQHANLRLYTLSLNAFEEFQFKIFELMPKFKDEKFINNLSIEIDQLRGRELPGFLSSQAFYLFMSQYVEMWSKPAQDVVTEICAIAHQVTGDLAESLLSQYPNLCKELQTIASRILNDSVVECKSKLTELISREKDPFTLNDFLQQWINKLRYDRFSDAVDASFDNAKSSAVQWDKLKSEIFESMKVWYRETHSVSPLANAREMASILEAYWNLSSKRFVDSCCMLADKALLDHLPSALQQQMFLLFREDKKLQDLFAEDPGVVKQRQDAEIRRDQLQQAAAALASIPVYPDRSTQFDDVDESNVTDSFSVQPGVTKLSISVNVGSHGLGVIVAPTSTNQMGVKEFRAMPDGARNPSKEAGLQIGDILEEINGKSLVSPEESVKLLRAAKGTIKFTVVRKTT